MAEAATLHIEAIYSDDLKNVATNVENLLADAEKVASKHKIKIDIDTDYLNKQKAEFTKVFGDMYSDIGGSKGAAKTASKNIKSNTKQLAKDYVRALTKYDKDVRAAQNARADIMLTKDARYTTTGGMAWKSKSKQNKEVIKSLNDELKELTRLNSEVAKAGLENDKDIVSARQRVASLAELEGTKQSYKEETKAIKDFWSLRTRIDRDFATGKSDVYYDKSQKKLINASKETEEAFNKVNSRYEESQALMKEVGEESARLSGLTSVQADAETKYGLAIGKVMPTQRDMNNTIQEYGEFLAGSQASKLGSSSLNRDIIESNLEDLKALREDGDIDPLIRARKYNELTQSLKDNRKAIIDAGEATSSFGGKLGAAFKKYAQYFGVSRAIMATARTLKQMASASIEVESAMNRIQIVTGASDAEMSSFYETASAQAQELGKSITDVAGSIETFSRLGYSLKDASELSKYATIMSNVGDVDVGSATTGITSIIKGYKMDASDAEHVSDVLVNVGKKYAISAEELMQAFERGGAALSASGTDFEKSAALFAATNASLQNAQTTGTMWKTVSARIRGAKSELEEMGEDTSDLAEGFSKNREELEALTGVDIMKNENEYKDLYTIFTELAHVWDDINGDPARARVAEILGGTRQLSGIMSTINNIKDAEGAYKDAMDSAGVSAKSNAKYMETTAASVGKLKATFQDFSSDFMSSSFLKGAVDTGNTLLSVVDKIANTIGGGKMAAGLGAIVASIIQIRNASKTITKAGEVKSVTNVLSNAFPKISQSVRNAKSAFVAAKGIGADNIEASMASISSLPTAFKAVAAIGVGAAIYKAFDYINTGWTRAQESAGKARDAFEEANSELETMKSQRTENLERATDIAANYDVDVTGLDTVDEVIGKIESSNKGITLVDQVELEKLSTANSQLETELKIQEAIAKTKKETAEGRTEWASRKEKSYWEHLKEEYGTLGAIGMMGIQYSPLSNWGVKASADVVLGEDKQGDYARKDTSNIGLAESTLKDLQKQKKELPSSISKTTSRLSEYIEAVSTEADVLSKSDSEYAKEYTKRAQAVLKGFRQIDMTKSEKIKDDLDTFFEGNDSLKKYLSDASGSASELEAALGAVGLSLSDLGIKNIEKLRQYLGEAANAAGEASNATESFRKSVSDVENAANTDNQDKDWSTIQSSYNTAREMLKQGKTGTDDFQVMAQFLSDKNIAEMAKKAGKTGSEVADAYEKSFRSAMKTADRWFGTDEDTATDNFIADMQSKGLFSKDLDEMGHWKLDAKFNDTAEAAKKFGVSVGAVETMLKSLEAYGYDFSGVKKSGEMLNEYKQTLDNLKQTYDSMDNGEAKDRLGRLISGFESEYGKYEQDLSKLDEDHVVHIKFEYDLATLQNEIDHKLREIENNGGRNNPDNSPAYAEVITKQQNFEKEFNEKTGLGRDGIEMPVQFRVADDEQKRLYEKLSKTTDPNERVKIQADIANQGEIKDKIRTELTSEHPEITPDVKVDDANQKIQEFANDSGLNTITLKGEVDWGDVDQKVGDKLDKYPDATINFKANIDGIDRDISAVKDEDGNIHYKAIIDGEVKEFDLNKDGTIHWKADTSNAKPSAKDTTANGTVNYSVGTVAKPDSSQTTAVGKINYVLGKVASVAGGGGKKGNNNDVPVNGTAYRGRRSFADGSWGTKKGGTALGGELGTELLVRDGHWYTIGDNGAEFFKYKKDDIIFNAEQTKQLFEKGRITYGNTRGIAYATGTAFHKDPDSGGKKGKKKGKKKGGGSGSPSSKAMDKFKNWFDKLFDWIEIRLERQAKKIESFTHKAERLSKAGKDKEAAAQYKNAISAQHTQLANAQQAEIRYDKQAEAVLSKAMKTKNKKGKALLSKKQAADIRAKVANGTIDIKSYSKNIQEIIKDYQQWYDKAREAAEKAQEMSEAIVDSYKTIADSYKEAASARMSLAKTRSSNAAKASEKNDYLVSAASELDKQVEADKEAISGIKTEMGANGQAAKSIYNFGNAAITKATYKKGQKVNGKKLTKAQAKKLNADNAKNTAAAKNAAEQAKSYAKSGQTIPQSVLDTLASYVNKGFLSPAFYSACLNYNSIRANGPAAIAEMQLQLEEDEANMIAEKISIGSEMVENVQNEHERKIKALETQQSLLTTAGYEMQKKDYENLIDLLQKEQEAIQAAIKRNVDLGYWTKSTPEYLDAINDLDDITKTIQENTNAIAELPYNKIEKALEVLDAIAEYNESLSSLKDASGDDLNESDYMIQMDDNSKKIEEFRKRASQAESDIKKASSNGGYYAGKTVEDYTIMMKEALSNVNKLLEENKELEKSMRDDVFWRTFERAHKEAQNLLDVVSGIADLISDDMYFKDGSLTNYGISHIANMVKEYELARREVENYSKDIKNLNSLLAQGFYPDQDEYNEKLAELQQGLLDSAKNMKDYIDDVISMYKDLDQNELDALFKLIDARNDALNAKKEYYDYDKTIRSKTKDIQELTAQIAALEGISTAEAKAQRAKLQEQLADAQEDLQDVERDHYFSMMQDALSDMKETMQDQFDDKWEYLSQDLTKIIELMNAANDLAAENAGLVTRTLDNLLSFYGVNANETGINKAYASGVRRVNGRVVGLSNEKGSELLVTKHGLISHFNPGDGVVPANLTERLYNLAQSVKPGSSLGKANIGKISPSAGITINQNYDSMLNIEGSADAATVSDLKRMSKDLLEKSYDYTSKRIQHDYTRTGGLRRA